ncbi:MAG TPA: glycosyltransferase family 4 protein [Solirubrobacteraceae bacterium]|jgi:glycosyltransferase involved in cell wall biosynthesis
MKIRLLMENAFVGGGTSRTVSVTASALAERGHDVELVSLFRRRKNPMFPPYDERVRITVLVDEYRMKHGNSLWKARGEAYKLASRRGTTIGHRSDYRSLKWNSWSDYALKRWLARVNDGILVGTRPNINLVIARFARPGPVLVAQDHVNFETYRPGIQKAIPRWYGRFDAIVTLTERNARDYEQILAASPSEGAGPRILSIPNGVPTEVGAHRATLDEKVVVSLGRLAEQKGYDRLLPVWAKVAEQRPDWKLEIYGGGDSRDALQGQLEALGLAGRAELMGRTKEPFARLAEASLFVMSSRREGMPMVLLEAMGVGLPVVSYDCPTGPRELIEDGVDGYVVPDGDEDALAARMLELMDDRAKRAQFAEAARRKAAEYDVRALAARWERLFQELAAAKADGSR